MNSTTTRKTETDELHQTTSDTAADRDDATDLLSWLLLDTTIVPAGPLTDGRFIL